MPDPDTAIRACNGLREHLALLHALAANSPFWHGADAKLASARFVLRRGFPRVEVPRAFRDFDDWEQAIAPLLAAGDLPDYTYLWWDARPHPNLGTVEVRVMDAQSSLRRAAAMAALVHGLAVHEALTPRREWLERCGARRSVRAELGVEARVPTRTPPFRAQSRNPVPGSREELRNYEARNARSTMTSEGDGASACRREH